MGDAPHSREIRVDPRTIDLKRQGVRKHRRHILFERLSRPMHGRHDRGLKIIRQRHSKHINPLKRSVPIVAAPSARTTWPKPQIQHFRWYGPSRLVSMPERRHRRRSGFGLADDIASRDRRSRAGSGCSLAEGLPCVVLVVLTLLVLSHRPSQAHWRSDDEKRLLQAELEAAQARQAHSFKAVLRNPKSICSLVHTFASSLRLMRSASGCRLS